MEPLAQTHMQFKNLLELNFPIISNFLYLVNNRKHLIRKIRKNWKIAKYLSVKLTGCMVFHSLFISSLWLIPVNWANDESVEVFLVHQSLVLRNAFLILKLLQIPTTIEHAKQLAEKLKTKDAKFNSFHLEVIDLIDEADTEALENEQETLDEHEDFVADMSICLKRLCTDATPADLKRISRKLYWSKSLLPYTMPSPYYQQIMTTCHSLNNMNTIIRIQLQYKMELSALHHGVTVCRR